MIAKSGLNNENEFIICFHRYNNGGLDESSTCVTIKIGLMSQAFRELTIFPGGY